MLYCNVVTKKGRFKRGFTGEEKPQLRGFYRFGGNNSYLKCRSIVIRIIRKRIYTEIMPFVFYP
tara:strand:+ start:329 stop:520 length:192 start_codon:yes stop_codon:yes gene_type:complete